MLGYTVRPCAILAHALLVLWQHHSVCWTFSSFRLPQILQKCTAKIQNVG